MSDLVASWEERDGGSLLMVHDPAADAYCTAWVTPDLLTLKADTIIESIARRLDRHPSSVRQAVGLLMLEHST